MPGSYSALSSRLFGDMPEVVGAALHSQTLAEAPASVTVITQADIRKHGCRTLGDVLASARGFTVTIDHITQSSGVRGFAVPGDYNTCFLVMINGHAMTEIAGNSNSFFGQDFGLDLGGILATINIVAKTPVKSPRAMVSTESGNGGPQKALCMSSLDLGRGANLLIEDSGFLTRAQNLIPAGFRDIRAKQRDGQPCRRAERISHLCESNGEPGTLRGISTIIWRGLPY